MLVLIERLRTAATHTAVVVDEYGTVQGVRNAEIGWISSSSEGRHRAARRTAWLTDRSAFLNCSIGISLETPYTSWNNYELGAERWGDRES